MNWEPENKIVSDADEKQDVTSLQRKLDKHLVLLTQQTVGKKKYFLPPQGIRQDGETLKQVRKCIVDCVVRKLLQRFSLIGLHLG